VGDTPASSLWKAHLALWGVGLIYAYNYLVAKGLMPEKIGPSGFIALRVAGATPLFWLLYAFRWERVARADLARLWLCGLSGVTINQLLFFNGLAATSPVHASIIMTINPVLVLLISAAVLGTAITSRKVAGIALGAAGAITLLLNSGGGGLESHASWQGDLMVLLNAASYGVYLVAVKPLMAKYRPLTVISWVFLFGGLMALPVGASQAAAIEWSTFSTQDWLSVGFVVLFTTFLVYLLNIYALGKVQPTVVSIYIYLQPLLVGGMVWLAATLGGADYMADMGWLQSCCAVVIATGVWLVSVPTGGWKRRAR